MEERVLSKKKNGMAALFGILLLFVISVAGIVAGSITIAGSKGLALATGIVMLVVGILLVIVSCVLCGGLKVLKPQEALVLTLFGRYVGTLKEDGFYFVNPFCTSVNPAAKTKLSQSGDVSAPAPLHP